MTGFIWKIEKTVGSEEGNNTEYLPANLRVPSRRRHDHESPRGSRIHEKTGQGTLLLGILIELLRNVRNALRAEGSDQEGAASGGGWLSGF